MSYLDGLNEKQLEAVSETEGYVRVIAGAGSGKTKLLVCRYAYLVREYGIDSSNILCVTFTNKAAGEMKRRIQALIGDENETSLICTYHGFCARLLREDAEKLFLPKSFQIIDSTQQKTILGEIYQKRELKLDHASFEKILKVIDLYKSEQYMEYVPRICSPENIRVRSVITSLDEEIMEEYMQRQKAIGALDFTDLISFALYLLETNAAVREKWQERLNYIQVDEFQDSSVREMHLIDILSGSYGNVMIVGDPDQNIYEWRGSDVKLLVDFDKTHTPTKTIILNRNYRSTPQILACANTLIDRNTLRLKKDLYTKAPPGADVVHYHSKTESEETKIISDLIKEGVRNGTRKYSDYAVLYRSGFLSRVVENRMVEQGIPYEIYGGVKFYQRMEILDVIAYLRLIAFNDDISFKRIVNKPRRRFGRTKMNALEQLQEDELQLFFGVEQPHLFDILAAHVNESPFKNSEAPVFVKWVKELRDRAGSLQITELVNCITTETGYEQYIRELGDEERYENLMEFKRIADEFERSFGEQLTLPEFLQQIALQAGEDTEQVRDAVKLMTIHAAKGLEFPAVFVIGFSEGIFPSSKTIEERKLLGLEEERRLCYVAITRAEDQLYLMDSEGQSPQGIKKLPSRFLREIGTENYTRIGIISKELDRESRAYSHRLDEKLEMPREETGFADGETVTHHIFGEGTVIANDPVRRTIRVQFPGVKMPRNLSYDYFKEEHGHVMPVKSNVAAEPERPLAEFRTGLAEDRSPQKETWAGPEPEQSEMVYKAVPIEEEYPDDEMFTDEPIIMDEADEFEEGYDQRRVDPEVLARLNDAENLWKRDDVPHSGWTCTGVTDLGAPVGICEMCGHQIIRYAHHMVHPQYRPIVAGCYCAGKMEGNMDAARERERNLKNQQARKESFLRRQWKRSRNGNEYLKIRSHLIVLFKFKNGGGWKYAIDSTFADEVFGGREQAVFAAFQAFDKLDKGTV